MTKFEELEQKLQAATALGVASTLLSWDSETLAPPKAVENTSKIQGILAGQYFAAIMDPSLRALAAQLADDPTLDLRQRTIIKELNRQFREFEAIPQDEYAAYQALLAMSGDRWRRAKEANDYAAFAPTLQQVLDTTIHFATLRAAPGQAPMDVLLNDYEEGFTTPVLDAFFEKLKAAIVPLLRRVTAAQGQRPAAGVCPVPDQDAFCRWLAAYIGFDFERGVLGTTEHPFTTALHNRDVRITTHYYPDDMERGMFSVLHEGGHGLYEMGFADALTLSPAAGAGFGLHESQSRFYENVVGRSPDFWAPIYPRLQAAFPAYAALPLEDFIRRINWVEPGCIRTEADELTYSLHIMVRYELEKELFAGRLTAQGLPDAWRKKYQEYLGVTPPSDAQGVLQDVHWAQGSLGYFPSYALGNAIAAQIYYHLEKTMPFAQYLREGRLGEIQAYLAQHIHRHGLTKTTNEILQDMTGEGFNADYYIRYLTEKYEGLFLA